MPKPSGEKLMPIQVSVTADTDFMLTLYSERLLIKKGVLVRKIITEWVESNKSRLEPKEFKENPALYVSPTERNPI